MYYYTTKTRQTNEYLNVSNRIRLDFLLQYKFGKESNINLLSKDVIKYLFSFIDNMLLNQYKMIVWNIKQDKFLIESSLQNVDHNSPPRNILFDNETPFIQKLSKENEKINLAVIFVKILEFLEHCQEDSKTNYNFGHRGRIAPNGNKTWEERIGFTDKWEKEYVNSLDLDLAGKLLMIAGHLNLPPLSDICSKRYLYLLDNKYLNQ